MTIKLIAKPVINEKYWLVTDGTKKVGNVIAEKDGFNLILNGTNTYYDTTDDIRAKNKIKFQTIKSDRSKIALPFAAYPTPKEIYNSIFDVKKQLHLFTEAENSKCYHVAGWFVMDIGSGPEVIFCPKYIFIQRYEYNGPYKTKTAAKKMINTLTE